MKKWGGRLLLALLSLTIAVVLAEVALRLLDLAPSASLFTVTEREFARIPGIHSPNQDAVLQAGSPLEHRVTTNSLGYRGPEFPRAKPAGERRVVFTGDSFTWGSFVEDDETLPVQLERRLRVRCRDSRVINAGAAGFDIQGETQMVLRSLELEPDLVIVMFYENDVIDLAAIRMWEQLAINRRAKSRFPLSLAYPVLRNTALWNLALDVTRTYRTEASVQGRQGAGGRPDLAEARREYERHLATLEDSLAARGIPMLFVAIPAHRAITEGVRDEEHAWATSLAADHGLPVVDLYEPFATSGLTVNELYLIPYDAHTNARANTMAADTVARVVENLLTTAPCGDR